MAFDWTCADKLAALSLGCVGIAIGDPGTMVGAAVGGVGLIGAWNAARQKFGLESDRHLQRTRKTVLAGCEDWARAEGMAMADIKAADAALDKHLADCIPDFATLAALAKNRDRYPKAAAEHVVTNLAAKDGLFRKDAGQFSQAAADFALEVVTRALTDALEQEQYAAKLRTQMMVEMLHQIDALQDAQAQEAARSAEADSRHDAKLDQLAALARQIVAGQQDEAAKRGVNAAKLVTLANRIVQKVSDPQEAERALHSAIDELLKLRAEAQRGSNFGDEIDETIRRIFARVEDNDLEGASSAAEEEYRRLGEQAAELRAAQLRMAETRLSLARLEYDAKAVAKWAIEMRRQENGGKAPLLDHLRWEMRRYYDTALASGQRLDLDVAIELARLSINAAVSSEDSAMCQNDLGNTLRVQGERSDGALGSALLKEAVGAYRAALNVRTREALPVDWAMTQNNLANALQVQGGRSGGAEGFKLYEEAVAAYRAALTVYTREALPADWAMTQSNLGAALQAHGERYGGAEGIVFLEQAVTAYRAALTVHTREAMPVDWAMTQNNLGNALQVQGGWSGRAEGITLVAEAVTAYREASTVLTREAMPALWAMTHQNLALANECIGGMSEGLAQADHWRVAEKEILKALEVYDPVNMPYDHSTATRILTRIRAKIAEAEQTQ